MSYMELGIEGQVIPFEPREQALEQRDRVEDAAEDIARILPFRGAVVRHAVHEEALGDLAEVVDLGLARQAVNEAYGLSNPSEVLAFLPTGTEGQPTPVQKEASRPQLVETGITTSREAVKHQFKSRGATPEDVEALVDVDMLAFEGVYKNSDMTREELRQDLVEKFKGRLDMLGGDWIRVVERDGIIAGFMTCCPTNKTPEEFESWEKTTDNGTLQTTYDPNGKNMYVVSLSMLSGVGEGARNMLFADQIGKMVEGGFERAFFESRLPGLGTWARRACRDRGVDFDTLNTDQQQELADEYFASTKTVKGKEVPLDRLIRIYTGVGCKFNHVVPDAYDDPQSMNFGAVGIFENPLPNVLQKSRLISKAVGKTLRVAAKSHRLMEKMF